MQGLRQQLHTLYDKKYPAYKIINLDKLTYGAILRTSETLKAIPYKFVKGMLRQAVEKIFSGNKIDAVVNFAAESHVGRSITDPVFYPDRCLRDICTARCCKRYQAGVFLQISTDEVWLYRKGPLKTDPLETAYSASKLAPK